MTYEKHLSGKHYMIYDGPWLVVWLYVKTGVRLGRMKQKLVYKGVK